MIGISRLEASHVERNGPRIGRIQTQLTASILERLAPRAMNRLQPVTMILERFYDEFTPSIPATSQSPRGFPATSAFVAVLSAIPHSASVSR